MKLSFYSNIIFQEACIITISVEQKHKEIIMIANLSIKIQYGRMTQSGVNLVPDLDGEANEVFAHSTQDALDLSV
jgi:hypothetical protein